MDEQIRGDADTAYTRAISCAGTGQWEGAQGPSVPACGRAANQRAAEVDQRRTLWRHRPREQRRGRSRTAAANGRGNRGADRAASGLARRAESAARLT